MFTFSFADKYKLCQHITNITIQKIQKCCLKIVERKFFQYFSCQNIALPRVSRAEIFVWNLEKHWTLNSWYVWWSLHTSHTSVCVISFSQNKDYSFFMSLNFKLVEYEKYNMKCTFDSWPWWHWDKKKTFWPEETAASLSWDHSKG